MGSRLPDNDDGKTSALAVVADILALAVYWQARPWIHTQFEQRSSVNTLLILLLYLAFCSCILLIRKFNPRPTSPGSRGALGMLGVFYGFMLTFMALDTGGFFEDPDRLMFDLDTLTGSLGLTVGVILYIALVFLYPIILVADIRPAAVRNPSMEFLSLAGVNLMIMVTAVHWEVYFADTEPYESVSLGGKLLIFFLVFVFFLLFYAPPRLFLLLGNRAPLAGASFLLQCGIYVYQSLSKGAW